MNAATPTTTPTPATNNGIQLEISKIRTDGGTQPRVAFDVDLVAEYSADMLAGDEFPPVIVFFDNTTFWLADGFHRIRAAIGVGLKTINVLIKMGTLRDAVLYSVGVNADHGKRRTNADKRSAVEKMLKDAEWCAWSDGEIARRCKVTRTIVANMRPSLVFNASENNNGSQSTERTFVNRYGTSTTMNTANIAQANTDRAYPTPAPYVPAPTPVPYVPTPDPEWDSLTQEEKYARHAAGCMTLEQWDREQEIMGMRIIEPLPMPEDDDDDGEDGDDDTTDNDTTDDDDEITLPVGTLAWQPTSAPVAAPAPKPTPTMYERMLTDLNFRNATLAMLPQIATLVKQITEQVEKNHAYANCVSYATCVEIAVFEVLSQAAIKDFEAQQAAKEFNAAQVQAHMENNAQSQAAQSQNATQEVN